MASLFFMSFLAGLSLTILYTSARPGNRPEPKPRPPEPNLKTIYRRTMEPVKVVIKPYHETLMGQMAEVRKRAAAAREAAAEMRQRVGEDVRRKTILLQESEAARLARWRGRYDEGRQQRQTWSPGVFASRMPGRIYAPEPETQDCIELRPMTTVKTTESAVTTTVTYDIANTVAARCQESVRHDPIIASEERQSGGRGSTRDPFRYRYNTARDGLREDHDVFVVGSESSSRSASPGSGLSDGHFEDIPLDSRSPSPAGSYVPIIRPYRPGEVRMDETTGERYLVV